VLLDDPQERIVEHGFLLLVGRKEVEERNGVPSEKLVHELFQSRDGHVGTGAASSSHEGVNEQTGPPALFSDTQGGHEPFGSGRCMHNKVLSHDGDVDDGLKREIPGRSDGNLAQKDRSGPDGGELHLVAGRALDVSCRPGRHPEVIVGGEHECIGIRPSGSSKGDLNPRLDELK
jgi:hypothetical protein